MPFLPIRIALGSPPVVVPKPAVPLWRVFHDYEVFFHSALKDKRSDGSRWNWRAGGKLGVPEVFNFTNGHETPFSEGWQRLSLALNPGMSTGNDGWRALYDDHRAFMNGSSFDSRDGKMNDGWKDYVNGALDGNRRIPFWDTTRVCGGATITGVVQGDYLLVETLRYDAKKPNQGAPDIAWLLERPWLYFTATTVVKMGDGPNQSKPNMEKVGDFPQNGGRPCRIPLVSSKQVKFPLAWLQEVNGMADPYRIYLR